MAFIELMAYIIENSQYMEIAYMASKEGWNLEGTHDKITLGRKQYRNMEEWSRPCGICGVRFSIHVRQAAGTINSSFGLRTCKEHRGQKIGGPAMIAFEQHEELERLQNWENTFFEVLRLVQTKMPDATMTNLRERVAMLIKAADDVYAAYQALRVQHELAPAMAAQATQNKMPWEG